jgi:hypothetical protein
MSDIKINFINNSEDMNNSEVVIFQKNVATNFDELSVAWKTLKSKPGQSQSFDYPASAPSTIWVNVATNIIDEKVMSSATLNDENTKLDLSGIRSANIVMKGGGSGPNASPFQFSLENIKS